jgi:creatinine amidohydrolase
MNAHEKSSSLSRDLDDQKAGAGNMAPLHHENVRESAQSVDDVLSMRISKMNWMMVEEYLQADHRAVLPLGCTEQHGFLSLSTDSILAERLAVEAADPLGIPVFPVLSYGITPYFRAFPGTITLRVKTYVSVVGDILDAIAEHGFERVLIVNGHGGNIPVQGFVGEWIADHPGVRIKFHNWWNAPKVWAQVQAIDPVASHASWMENFPWTRLQKVNVPSQQKAMSDPDKLRRLDPKSVREYLKDGNYGGLYQRDDEEMMKIWRTAVEETRTLLMESWD